MHLGWISETHFTASQLYKVSVLLLQWGVYLDQNREESQDAEEEVEEEVRS
jgi:hypothetical protein